MSDGFNASSVEGSSILDCHGLFFSFFFVFDTCPLLGYSVRVCVCCVCCVCCVGVVVVVVLDLL